MAVPDTGAVGERTLDRWCAELGVNANPAIRDKGGWDFYLEYFEGEPRFPEWPADLQPPALKCRVQVKTTSAKRLRAPSAKVSSLLRLVNDPCPAFLLQFRTDRAGKVKEARLLHMGRAECGQVLRRSRQISLEDGADVLARRSMSVNVENADRLVPCGAESFWVGVVSAIGDYARYVREKADWLPEIGYDMGRLQLNFQLDAKNDEEAVERIVDFALGLRTLRPVNLTALDLRFGIPAPHPRFAQLSSDTAIDSMNRPPDGTAMLRYKALGEAKSVEVGTKYYSPLGAVPWLPREAMKVRFDAACFRVVVALGSGKHQYSFWYGPALDGVELGELIRYQSVLSIMRSSGGFQIAGRFAGGPWVELGEGHSDESFPADVGDEFEAAVRLARLADRIGLDRKTSPHRSQGLPQRAPPV